MQNLSLHQFLKMGTQDLHTGVEQESLLSRLFTDEFSSQDYQEILTRFFQIYSVLESKLQANSELESLLPDLQQRWKLESLKKDLRVVPEPLELPVNRPMDSMTLSQALGVLYVLEGSTLGGQVIQRKLKQNPNLNGETFHFYNHYAEKTGPFWKSFLEALEIFSHSEAANREQCLQAARQTFQLMMDHFKESSRVSSLPMNFSTEAKKEPTLKVQ